MGGRLCSCPHVVLHRRIHPSSINKEPRRWKGSKRFFLDSLRGCSSAGTAKHGGPCAASAKQVAAACGQRTASRTGHKPAAAAASSSSIYYLRPGGVLHCLLLLCSLALGVRLHICPGGSPREILIAHASPLVPLASLQSGCNSLNSVWFTEHPSVASTANPQAVLQDSKISLYLLISIYVLGTIMAERELIGKDKLVLRGLQFHGFHGVKQEEKTLGQKFVVDVDSWIDLSTAGETDNISDTVSYTDIYRIVKDVIEGPSQNLLESVAHRIASGTLHNFPQISAVRVKVGKPHVAIQGTVDYLGVEIFRYRKDMGENLSGASLG